jgi:hypothetical protein
MNVPVNIWVVFPEIMMINKQINMAVIFAMNRRDKILKRASAILKTEATVDQQSMVSPA